VVLVAQHCPFFIYIFKYTTLIYRRQVVDAVSIVESQELEFFNREQGRVEDLGIKPDQEKTMGFKVDAVSIVESQLD
jgi:hypothetical protein